MQLETLLVEGKSNKVYKSGNYAVKVFNSRYKKSDVLQEAITTTHLEELGLAVPSIHQFIEENGTYMLVMDYIEGKTLLSLMTEHPEQIASYMEQMISIQMEIHRKRCPFLPMLKSTINEELKRADIPRERMYELRQSLDSTPKHIKLIHGDFNPSNIIITNDGVPHLIDTNYAAQGNASADVATSYLWFCINRPDLGELYLDTYARMSGTERSYIERWLPIIAATRLKRNVPEERDILLKWIDTYIYTD